MIFEKQNISNGWKCLICNNNEEKKVVLIAIHGTNEGKIVEAQQFHLDCVLNNLVFWKEKGFIGLGIPSE